MGIIFIAYFLSGALGLCYQILWARELSYIFGATVYGQALSISLFMGGLALGSYFGGKAASRTNSPLKYYALLEGGIGIFGFLGQFISDMCVPFNAMSSGAGVVICVFISAAFILPATTWMGMTFPILFQALNRTPARHEARESYVSFLYVANASGALCGILWCGFYSIERLGVHETFMISAGLNLLLMMWFLGKRFELAPLIARPPASDINMTPGGISPSLSLIFLAISGFNTMSFEVSWSRLLHFSFGSSTHSFSLILFAFIFGLTWGARWERKIIGLENLPSLKDRLATYQLTIMFGSILFLFFTMRLPLLLDGVLQWSEGKFFIFTLIELAILTLLLLPTAFPIGASFPLLCELYQGCDYRASKRLGTAYAFNTLGSILGAMLTGFVLIPLLGPIHSIWINLGCQVFMIVCLLYHHRSRLIRTYVIMGILCAFQLANVVKFNVTDLLRGTYTRYYADKDDQGMTIPYHLRNIHTYWVAREQREKVESGENTLVWMKHGIFSTVGVTENNNTRQLVLDGKTDASVGPFYLSDMPTQTLLALLPVWYAPEWNTALVIGLGSGVTASMISDFATHVDCVELEQKVFEAGRFFKNYNFEFWNQPHVHMHITDARRFIQRTPIKYDFISSEPSNLWMSGVSSLFSRDFFQRGASVLNEDGVFVQWIHTYKLSVHDFQTVVNTFSEVFPVIELWGSLNIADFFLVGLKNENTDWNADAFLKRLDSSRFASHIKAMHLDDPNKIKHFRLIDRHRFKDYIHKLHSNIHTDNHPVLEFSAARNMYTFEVRQIYDFLDQLPDDPG